eukprot:3774669-Pleurochrysis_carterae.AAC.3
MGVGAGAGACVGSGCGSGSGCGCGCVRAYVRAYGSGCGCGCGCGSGSGSGCGFWRGCHHLHVYAIRMQKHVIWTVFSRAVQAVTGASPPFSRTGERTTRVQFMRTGLSRLRRSSTRIVLERPGAIGEI